MAMSLLHMTYFVQTLNKSTSYTYSNLNYVVENILWRKQFHWLYCKRSLPSVGCNEEYTFLYALTSRLYFDPQMYLILNFKCDFFFQLLWFVCSKYILTYLAVLNAFLKWSYNILIDFSKWTIEMHVDRLSCVKLFKNMKMLILIYLMINI